MILNNRDEDLNIMYKIIENSEEFVIFATSGNLKCFGCGQEGHSIGNCPEREAAGNQETKITKEINNEGVQTNDKQDSGEKSGNTEGQEDGKDAENETKQMETERENPQVNASENATQNTHLTNRQINEECSGTENTDMAIDDAGCTLVRSKRKCRTGNSGPQTGKKGLVEIEKGNQVINGQEAEVKSSSDHNMNAETESDEDEQNSDEHTAGYKVKEIKRFLQKTKNMKGTRVDQYFPNKQDFVDSATAIIKEKNRGFTHQEIFRLKKFVTRTSRMMKREERQWWDHGKVLIQQLCQQYTANVTRDITKSLRELGIEIVELQTLSESTGNRGHFENLKAKKALMMGILGTETQGALCGSQGPAVSLFWLLDEPLVGGGRMDIKDSSPVDMFASRLADVS
ncbi:hypothetical protein QTP70_011046 [Hemibagrus guttatus]|uniref:CCHC-type domain-containing protein n=1 Tax=Hemibagrus guttatus TaxID=175788 RepID=A0AAE0R0T4_9TELE|nr:hypothetical protein QTP70_011046 [Hemibagrus guttatus]